MISIPLLLSHNYPCSYLDNYTACLAFVDPSILLSGESYEHLLELGFRRSGNEVYRPHCPSCRQCVAVRIPVNQFQPSRKHSRCLKKNRLTRIRIKPAAFQDDHFRLYQKYQEARHGDGEMANSTPENYMDFLSCLWCDTWFVEFTIDDNLVAVAVVDRLDNCLSAVYTFFDPDYSSYSLGVLAVLWQIEQARLKNKDWLYLGYWIKDSRKMCYKTQFHPIQGFIDNQWLKLRLSDSSSVIPAG